jgi:hypothetical protein
MVVKSTASATTLVYYETNIEKEPYGRNEKGTINIRGYTISETSEMELYLKGKNEGDKDLKFKLENVSNVECMAAINDHIDYRRQTDEKNRQAQIKDMR